MTALQLQGLALGGWLFVTDNVWMIVGAIPFWNKMTVKRSTMVTWMVCVGLFQSVLAYFLWVYLGTASPLYGPLTQARKFIYYGLIVGFYLKGFKVHWAQLVYVFLFLQNASTMVNTISFMVNQLALGRGAVINFVLAPSYPALIVLLNIPAGIFIGRYFIRTVKPAFAELSSREAMALCGIPAVFLLVNTVMNLIAYNIYNNPLMSILYLLMLAAGLAAFMMNMRLMRESSQRARLAAENSAMVQMVDLQQRGYAQLTESIERTRAQRHDMRFHLSVISGHLKEREYDQATAFLDEYSHVLMEPSAPKLCGNRAVDVLARHFVGRIEALGAKTDVQLSLPEDAGIPDADLCVLFGNLLENALHSLQTQGTSGALTARCETDDGSMVIAIDNSCPCGTTFERGIGLNSVMTVAQKHGGTAEFDCAGGLFRASVILYMGQSDA